MEGVKGRRVLVAVDESEQSMHALKWSLDNLQLSSTDTLVLCHAQRLPIFYEGLGGPGYFLTPEATLSLEKCQETISEDVMKAAREICSGRQVTVEEKIVSGDARDGLCEAVKKFEADFLVVGSHAYDIIKRSFLESVSDSCADHAKCPIVFVKKPHH